MKLSKQRIRFLALTCYLLGTLNAAQVMTIPLGDGQFEDLDDPQVRKTNQAGAFSLPPNAWTFTNGQDALQGKRGLAICGPLRIHACIPQNLRGQSLELTFKAKGDCSLWFWNGSDLTEMIQHVNDKKGQRLRTLPTVKPAYNNFVGWDNYYPKAEDLKICFPPLDPMTTEVEIVLNQDTRFRYQIDKAPRKLIVDDFRLVANTIPVYQQGQPKPCTQVDTSFETGDWRYNSQHVRKIPATGDNPMKLALKDGAELFLPLPLAMFKGKSLQVRLKAKGNGKITPILGMGNSGRAQVTHQSPETLMPNQEMETLVWFSEIHQQADRLFLHFEVKQPAVISDVRLAVSDQKLASFPRNIPTVPGGKLPANYLEGRNPSLNGLVDVAPAAEVISTGDYDMRRYDLIDGSMGTQMAEPAILRFPKPVEIREFRVTLPPTAVLLKADTNGDGKFDTILDEMNGGLKFTRWGNLQQYVWYVKKLDKPVKVHSLCYVGGGYECRVLTTPEDAKHLWAHLPPKTVPDAPALTLGQPVNVPPAKFQDSLYYGFTLEPWMFGISRIMNNFYRNKRTPRPLAKWGRWKRLLKDYKKLHANFILLFPPHVAILPPGSTPWHGASYPAPVMWPSKVWYLNQPNDFLSQMSKSCRENNILNFVIPRGWLFKKGIPKAEVQFAKEIAERGAHGVPIGFDEQIISTGVNPKGMPGVGRNDTLRVRKGHLQRLEEIASVMKEIRTMAKKINPEAVTFGGYIGNDLMRDRLGSVSPHDAWGFSGDLDVMGGDGTYYCVGDPPFGSYVPAIASADYAAMTPRRQAMATNNFNWGIRWDEQNQKYNNPLLYDDYPNVALYGGALACYFNKATHMNFWRYNFMDENGGPPVRKAIARGGRMTAVLSSWGGKKATVPKDVLVLRSRTSEDWWHLRHWSKAYVQSIPQKVWEEAGEDVFYIERSKRLREQGFTQFNWCMTQLVANAIPNEIYMMNQFSAWKDRAKLYKVIMLPFPYAVSPEAAATLKAAAEAGVKIIALGGCGEGPVDELGEPHPQGPILKSMIDSGQIAFYDPKVIAKPNQAAIEEGFRNLVFTALKTRGGPSITLQRLPQEDVQCFMLEHSHTDKLVLLVNFSEKETAVNLGLSLPQGTYQMEICGLDDVRQGMIKGKTDFSNADLKCLQVKLPKEDTQILRIHTKEN